jgi:hypothetical protein
MTLQLVDVSKSQPANLTLTGKDGVFIQVSHGTEEEPGWRDQYNSAIGQGKQIGFYHFAETTAVVDEAHFFWDLIGGGWENPIPQLGFALDAETGQDEIWVSQFRQVIPAPLILYSDLDGFDTSMHGTYNQYPLNWVGWPHSLPPPISWLIWQYGQATLGGVVYDLDRTNSRITFPPYWNI